MGKTQKIGNATIMNVDCMEYMRTLPDKFFDLAVCDPPYGIGNWVQTSGNVRGAAVTWNDHHQASNILKSWSVLVRTE